MTGHEVLKSGNDSISELFDLQVKLQTIYGFDFSKMTTEERETYTKDTILYLLEEAHELLRETNFKKHKKVKKSVDPENIKEELADLFHFFINLNLVWNITPEQLVEAFKKKNAKNVERATSKDY
jgi:NTP pyrophosphatase (non-canonical NTP hydrolase)